MDYLRTLSHNMTKTVCSSNQHTESEKDKQVGIREIIDKLTYRIIWRNSLEEFTLTNPALSKLISGHLYPYGINRVGRDSTDIGNNNSLMT